MTTQITTRAGKGARLTDVEMDANFENLKATADQALSTAQSNGGGGGGGLPVGTTTDAITEGLNNKYYTDARVRSAGLNGLDTSSASDVTSSDNTLTAFGKLMAKFAALAATIRGNPLTGLDTGSSADLVDTDTTLSAFGKLQAKWNNFAASVRSTVLTGLSTASNTAVAAGDSVLAAIGKLQAQIDVRPTINAPVTLTVATNLTAAAHANRQIIFNGADANLTVQTDALGGFSADDEITVFTHESSPGKPTLVFPDASTLPGGKDVVIDAVRKATDTWQKDVAPKGIFGASARGLVPAADATPDSTKVLTQTGWAVSAGGGAAKADGTVSVLFQPHFGTTSATTIGMASLGAIDSSTSTTVNGGSSTVYDSQQRIRRTGAAAAISRLAGLVGDFTSPFLTPSATVTGAGGFKARICGAIADAIAAGQFGIGFVANTPAWTASSEPSAMTDCIFMGADSTDAHMQVMVNDGSGTCTKTDLGASFPNNTNAADWYVFEVTDNATGATRSINWTATNKINGATASGTISTNLPSSSTRLKAFQCRGSANTATTPVMDCGPIAAGHFF